MGERLVDEADTRAVQDQPGPEVPVRGPANRFVESADFQPAPALRGGELTQRLEALWMEHVVGIEDYDEVTGRHAGGAIFRGRLATVLLMDEPNSPGVRFERGSDVVRRAVVANDYFLCGPRLRER